MVAAMYYMASSKQQASSTKHHKVPNPLQASLLYGHIIINHLLQNWFFFLLYIYAFLRHSESAVDFPFDCAFFVVEYKANQAHTHNRNIPTTG